MVLALPEPQDVPEDDREEHQAHGEPGGVLLRRLADLGAVSLDDEEEGPVARLTPLG